MIAAYLRSLVGLILLVLIVLGLLVSTAWLSWVGSYIAGLDVSTSLLALLERGRIPWQLVAGQIALLFLAASGIASWLERR